MNTVNRKFLEMLGEFHANTVLMGDLGTPGFTPEHSN